MKHDCFDKPQRFVAQAIRSLVVECLKSSDLTVPFTLRLIGKINILLSEGLLLLEGLSFRDVLEATFFRRYFRGVVTLAWKVNGTLLTKYPQVLTVEPAEKMPLYI